MRTLETNLRYFRW